MTDNTVQLKNENILKLQIQNDKGEMTGDFLEFDLEDIELPLIYQDMIKKDKRNRQNLKNQFAIIDKKEDHRGKRLLSSNEEAKIRALNDFFKKETEIYNLFLGENGVQKLLAGRKLRWTTLNEIDEIIINQIAPQLNITIENINQKIKNKYSQKEGNVLE